MADTDRTAARMSPATSKIAHAFALSIDAAFEDGERREDLADRTGLPALATADLRMVGAGESAAEYELALEDGTVYVVTLEAKLKRSR